MHIPKSISGPKVCIMTAVSDCMRKNNVQEGMRAGPKQEALILITTHLGISSRNGSRHSGKTMMARMCACLTLPSNKQLPRNVFRMLGESI
jgi:hypothetical protein